MIQFPANMFKPFIFGVLTVAATFSSMNSDVQASERGMDFSYKGYSAGLLAARIHGKIDLTNNRFLLSLSAGDAGISSLFSWASQIDATGGLHSGGVAPQRFDLQSRRKKRSSTRAISYNNGLASVRFNKPLSAPAHEVITPSQTQGTIDPAAAFMAILNVVDQTGNCNLSMNVFDGKSLYRFDVQGIGIESISDRNLAFSGRAVKCRVSPTPLAGKAMRPKTLARMTTVDMWVAKPIVGGPMVPVKMTARVQGIPLTLLMSSVR